MACYRSITSSWDRLFRLPLLLCPPLRAPGSEGRYSPGRLEFGAAPLGRVEQDGSCPVQPGQRASGEERGNWSRRLHATRCTACTSPAPLAHPLQAAQFTEPRLPNALYRRRSLFRLQFVPIRGSIALCSRSRSV